MYSKIQYISQGENEKDQLHNIKMALEAGCEWIQLRFKNADEKSVFRIAERVKKISNFKFTFIINDYPFIAKKVDADGVHLGLEDMDLMTAREIVGDKKIIGGTANTIQQVISRIGEGANYIGLGPYRFTTTKAKLSPVLGLGGYQGILQVLHENKAKIPVYAIGGIEIADLPELMTTGIYGIAVSGLVANATDKKLVVEHLKNILDGTINNSW